MTGSARIPRTTLQHMEDFITAATRLLADTPGIETQELAKEGEAALLDLMREWVTAETLLSLWGPGGKPRVPAAAKSAGART